MLAVATESAAFVQVVHSWITIYVDVPVVITGGNESHLLALGNCVDVVSPTARGKDPVNIPAKLVRMSSPFDCNSLADTYLLLLSLGIDVPEIEEVVA